MQAEPTVALVTPWASKGGIVTYSEWLKSHLEAIGIDIRPVAIENQSSPNPLAHMRLLNRVPEETDIIHVQYEAGLFGRLGLSGIGAPAFFARLRTQSRPVVTTLHEVHRRHPHRGMLGDAVLRFRDTVNERLALGASAATVVHSRHAKQVLRDRHGDDHRLERMLHPVDPTASRVNQQRAKADLSIVGPAALTFGWIEPKKQYETVVRALQDHPELTYLIAGEPRNARGRDHLEDTLKLAASLGVDDQVRHLGYVPEDEIGTVFGAADVVILPYDRVGQSGVMNIALAHRRPVIASALPAFEELREEFNCLITYRDSDEFEDALAALLSDQTRRDQLMERIRNYAERVTWDRFAERTRAIYSDL